jgi:hypothetical protein
VPAVVHSTPHPSLRDAVQCRGGEYMLLQVSFPTVARLQAPPSVKGLFIALVADQIFVSKNIQTMYNTNNNSNDHFHICRLIQLITSKDTPNETKHLNGLNNTQMNQ